MGRLVLAAPPGDGGFGLVVVDDERVRDQLSAAEELLYVGHLGPAVVAAGVALEGAVRLSAAPLAGSTASWGALLEALLATHRIGDAEHELLYRALSARDRLAHGYMPEPGDALGRVELMAVVAVVVRLLEGCALIPFADAGEVQPSAEA